MKNTWVGLSLFLISYLKPHITIPGFWTLGSAFFWEKFFSFKKLDIMDIEKGIFFYMTLLVGISLGQIFHMNLSLVLMIFLSSALCFQIIFYMGPMELSVFALTSIGAAMVLVIASK